jgi:hypothetical protein
LLIAPSQISGDCGADFRRRRDAMLKVFSLIFLLSSVPSAAGEIGDAGQAAEKLATEGKFNEAFEAIETAREMLWKQSPLTFRKTIFVASEPGGFGMFDMRETTEFKRSEPLIIYTEPFGFAYGRDGQMYIADMALDFEITDATGASVASQENFGSWALRSRVPNKEFMGKLDYDFSGLEPGDYEVITTVRDRNSDKRASFGMKFKLLP